MVGCQFILFRETVFPPTIPFLSVFFGLVCLFYNWGMGLRCTLGGWAGWGGRCVHAGPRGPFASRSRGFAGGEGQHYRGMTAPTLRGGEACPFPIPVLYPFAGDYNRADYPCPGTAVHHYLSPKLALGFKYVEVTPGGLERIVGDPNDG